MDVGVCVGEVRGDFGERGEASGCWAAGERTGFVGDVGFEGLLGESGVSYQGFCGRVFVFDALFERLVGVVSVTPFVHRYKKK